MAPITWADVSAIAPEVTSVPVAAQTDILAYVNTELNVTEWGGESSITLRLGRIYLAAHLGVTTAQGGASAGPVVSESAGGLSRSYANTSTTGSRTGYQDMFKELLNRLPCRVPIVI